MRRTTGKSEVPSPRRCVEPPPKERFEILLEEIRDDVKVLLEKQTILRKEMTDWRSESNENMPRLEAR
jgi:hypothetical protein